VPVVVALLVYNNIVGIALEGVEGVGAVPSFGLVGHRPLECNNIVGIACRVAFAVWHDVRLVDRANHSKKNVDKKVRKMTYGFWQQ
jgi:hypothetical protein